MGKPASPPSKPRERGSSASAPLDEELERLRTIIERAHGSGVRVLSAAELQALPALYRLAATRLSKAQTQGDDPRRIQSLLALVRGAHALLYRDLSTPAGSAFSRGLNFVVHEAPRAIRAEWRTLALSMGLFYGLAALAYFLVSRDLELAFTFLDRDSVHSELRQLRETAADSEFRGNFTFGWSDSSWAAGAIMANNVRVVVLMFGAALLPPLFALLLVLNALMLGTYLGVASHWGQSLNIASILMCHGMLELQAIALGGAAGLVLARGLFLPGVWSRAHAMRLESARAWRLFVGVLPMLFFAGLIEGYVSPHAPLPARLAFMVGTGLALVAWVMLGGRNQRA